MDRRDTRHQWYSSFDAKRMVLVLEEAIDAPAGTFYCRACSLEFSFAASELDTEACPDCGGESGRCDLADLAVPAKYDVCETCDGHGSHVNPSIDSHGISADEFADDPDFREDYFSGRYDVPCAECHGARVVPVVDEDRCTPDILKIVHERIGSHYDYERERNYEARMGF